MDEFQEVKNYLDISWNDPETDARIAGIIQRAKAALKNKIGNVDFEKDEAAKQLLLDCCRYINAGILDEFYKNYESEILFFFHFNRIGAMEHGSEEAD